MKSEEHEFLIHKLTSQCAQLQHENNNILTENGRLADAVSALQLSLAEAKGHAALDMEFLEHRVQEVEVKSKILLARAQKERSDMHHNSEPEQQQTQQISNPAELQKMTQLALRRGRMASMAMIAKHAARFERERSTKVLSRLILDSGRLRVQANAVRAVLHVNRT